MSKKPDWNDKLMRAFKASGWTRNKLSEMSGVRYATIHGWAAGTRQLMLDSANRMGDVLGLDLISKKKER